VIAPWYAFILTLAKLLYGSLGGVRRVGEAHVPRSGAVLIAPVHFSTFDPPAVAIACPRQLRFMAKQELFKGIFGRGIRSVGAFPVRRGENDTESVRAAIGMLEDGQAVLVFPEGERGDGIRLNPMNPGLAMLAKRTGAPVVPTAVVGTHILKPRGSKKLKRTRMVIAFGEPMTFDQVAGDAGGAKAREAFSAELGRRLVALCAENGLALEG
jgi:1-acyl-sn-glycerol-3-phosphate acyltransferase